MPAHRRFNFQGNAPSLVGYGLGILMKSCPSFASCFFFHTVRHRNTAIRDPFPRLVHRRVLSVHAACKVTAAMNHKFLIFMGFLL